MGDHMAKDQICVKVYTYKNISDASFAHKLIGAFHDVGLCWDKIGDKEPLREVYSDELFLRFWDDHKIIGKPKEVLSEYSNVFCSKGRGRVTLMVGWKNSNPPKYSSVELFVSRKAFLDNCDGFFELFNQLISILDADYACICNWNFWRNIRGTYFTKIPTYQDVHWVTFFSHAKMQMMKGLVKELEWMTVNDLPQGTVCFMSENAPKDGDLIEERCLEYRSFLWSI